MCFFVLPDDFNGLAELGALKDLSDFTADDSTFDDGQFYDSAYAYGQLEGVQFALPYECAPKLMFVNKSILDREDIAMPEKDWTWNDFYEICSKVTKDTDGDGEIDQFGEAGYSWRDAFTSNGVELFNQDGTQCYLAGENTKKQLHLWTDWKSAVAESMLEVEILIKVMWHSSQCHFRSIGHISLIL